MIQSRTIRRQSGDAYRVWKFNTEDEMKGQLLDISTFFKQSTRILESGTVTSSSLELIKNYADDLAYQDLKLSCGDLFLFTKENLSVKTIEASKKEKAKFNNNGTPRSINNKELIRSPKKHGWTLEQEGYLWAGTAEEVAKIVRKRPNAVYIKRSKYMASHPNFIVPDKCKSSRKRSDVVINKPNEKTAENNFKWWTKTEVDMLWEDSGHNLVEILGRTYGSIYQKRLEFLKNNKDFVIPIAASFKLPEGLDNKTEELSPAFSNPVKFIDAVVENEEVDDMRWSKEELSKIWLGSLEEVAKMLEGKRTEAAIAFQRAKHRKENPEFVIPDAAKKRKAYTKRQNRDLKNEGAVLEETKLQPEKIQVVKQPEIRNEEVQQIPQSSSPRESKAQVPATIGSMSDIADLLNRLKVKPKRIKVNGIELEF